MFPTDHPAAQHVRCRRGYDAMLTKYSPQILREAGRKGYAVMIARYPDMPRRAGQRGFQRLVETSGPERACARLAAALARRPRPPSSGPPPPCSNSSTAVPAAITSPSRHSATRMKPASRAARSWISVATIPAG